MNKVLIIVYVPLIEKRYELFIPVCKKIASIVNLVTKAINELTLDSYPTSKGANLYNKVTAQKYDNAITIKNSDIRNGSEIVLI